MKLTLSDLVPLLGPDLATHDPYDLWKTPLGVQLRKLYYRHGKIAALAVAPFYLLDTYAPRLVRKFIKPQEYPIVRAQGALAALNCHAATGDRFYLDLASCSARWLEANRCPGYHGSCWGLNFPWQTKGGYYPPTTPFSTHTPYCVEALLGFHDATGQKWALQAAVSSLGFLEHDLKPLIDSADTLALGYGPGDQNRVVINSNSYCMMLYALLADRLPHHRTLLLGKAARLFRFVHTRQNNDGSWLYYDDNDKGNFIDCFHSCFVLKNLVKYGNLTGTPVAPIVDKGIDFIMANFVDPDDFLARRFTVAANPSMTRYDLYDQAELLHLLTLTGRMELANRLHDAAMRKFYLPDRNSFGSQVDIFGFLNTMNYLRWAVMPMVLALSAYYTAGKAGTGHPADAEGTPERTAGSKQETKSDTEQCHSSADHVPPPSSTRRA